MQIDWKRKLSSRRFWVALGGFVTALLTAFGADRMTVEQVTAVITALALLMSYVLGESHVDACRENAQEDTDADKTDNG